MTSSSTNMGGTARALAYRYDSNGNRTRITHPDGTFFSTDHDGLNRPTWMTDPLGSAVALTAYDALGAPVSLGRPGATTGYWVTGDGRLISLTHYLAAGLDVQWTFTHNPAGQIASTWRSNDAYAWGGAYTINRAYTTNGLNQYSAAGPAAFGYDANGNLSSDGTRTYAYDIENRLVGATGPSSGSGGPGLVLAYDPLGRLFRTSGGASGTTTYLYDGDALIAEYDAAGALAHRYVHGASAGADDPLVWYQGAGTAAADRRNLLADHQGSIVAVSDNAANRLGINSYDEYGIPAAGNVGRFQYTGQIWLPDLGMYHYKARIYSPTLGRFLQTDPIGYQDQVNLYAYVGNDPINLTDPSGEWICGPKSAEQCTVVRQALVRAREALPRLRGAEAAAARRAINAYGREGQDNGVTVMSGITRSAAETNVGEDGSVTVTINSGIKSIADLERGSDFSAAGVIAHEGTHVADAQAGWLGPWPHGEQEYYDTERRAYAVTASIDRSLGHSTQGGGVPLWRPGMTRDQIRQNVRHRAWNSGGRARRRGTNAW